jgi:hypothetical protein
MRSHLLFTVYGLLSRAHFHTLYDKDLTMNINKVLLCSTALLLPVQFAHAQEAPAINAQLAATDISGYNTGLALMVGYEHPIPALYKNLSVEGELAATVMEPEDSYTLGGTGYNDTLSYYLASVYLKYTHPLNAQFSIYGRVGVHYENITYHSDFFNTTTTDTGLGRNLGIGANYHFSPAMDFTLSATLFDTDSNNFNTDIKHISAGIKFKL